MLESLLPIAVVLLAATILAWVVAREHGRRDARREAAGRWATALGLEARNAGLAAFAEGELGGAVVHVEFGHQQGRLEAWIRVAAESTAGVSAPDHEALREMLLERGPYAVKPGEFVTGLAVADLPTNALPKRFARMAWFATQSVGLTAVELDRLNPRTPDPA